MDIPIIALLCEDFCWLSNSATLLVNVTKREEVERSNVWTIYENIKFKIDTLFFLLKVLDDFITFASSGFSSNVASITKHAKFINPNENHKIEIIIACKLNQNNILHLVCIVMDVFTVGILQYNLSSYCLSLMARVDSHSLVNICLLLENKKNRYYSFDFLLEVRQSNV